jgi:hypothetical protein
VTTPTTVQVRLQIRADTAANWTSVNPILLTNELGLESDTKKFKIGNGTSAWVDLAYFPSIVSGGTVLGNLEIGTTGTLTFEGSTANGFETTLGVVDPTADRTILLPNQSGTVVVGGNASITDADIAANAEIAVSKLADGAARQLLQTDAAGTGVEWTSNIDIPGTLDVTGAATFDGAVTVAGDLTVNGTTTTISTQNLLVEDKNIILGDVATPTDVTADGGGITLKGATDKTINWVDATDAWTSSERFSVPLGSAAAPSLTFTGDPNTGIYSPGADQVAISTNGTGRLFVDSNGNVGINTANTIAPGGFGYAREFALTGATSGDSAVSLNIRGSRTVAGGFVDINFWHQSTSNRAYIQARRGSSDSAIDLDFITSGGAGMRLDSSGRLGLGTSSPNNRLHVSDTSSTSATFERTGTTGAFIALKDSATQTFIGNTNGVFSIQTPGSSYSDKLVVTSTGLVGIGTTSPNERVDAGSGNFVTSGNYICSSSGRLRLRNSNNNNYSEIYNPETGSGAGIAFNYGGGEAVRIDSSGRLLVGTSSARSNFYNSSFSAALQLEGTDANRRLSITGADEAGVVILARQKSGSTGGNTILANGDTIGVFTFQGNDGSEFVEAATIIAQVDGTPGANDMPGRLVFSTTADGASSPTERMRITSGGNVACGVGADTTVRLHAMVASGSDRDIIRGSVDGVTNGLMVGWANSSSTLSVKFASIPTTASAANAFLDDTDSNRLYRSTSSIRYKTDVEDIDQSRADAVLNLRPVWYRSKGINDRSDWSWYGLIAEEVAEIEPRLVHWSYLEEDYEIEKTNEGIQKTLKAGAKLAPDGVQYERLTVLLLDVVKRQNARIETLEAKVVALEGV